MINLAELGRVFIVCGKTDMRRGIDSLAYIVKKIFNLDLFSGASFSSVAAEEIVSKHCIGMARDSGCSINALRTEKLAWPSNKDEVRELSDEQVMRLMRGFTINPKINTTRARECIDFTSFSGILMIMNQGGTTTMTGKETSALIETLRANNEMVKANNEELLKQVALLTEQVAYLTNKLYGKSSEKRAVNPDQLSLFEEDNASQDDEDLPSHYRNYYL